MADFSIVEKLKIVITTIFSTPLFSISFLLGLGLIVLMIFCIIKKKKISKWIYIVGWALVLAFIGLKYTKLVPTLVDNLIETFIKCIYFPSLGLYIGIVILANLLFIIINFQRNVYKTYKVVTLVCAVILNILFILVAGVMTKNKIDITSEINLYTNSTLLVLLQISMFIFLIMILILLFIKIYNKMKMLDAVKFGEDCPYPEMDMFTLPAIPHHKDEVFVRKIFPRKTNNNIKVHKLFKK